MANVDAFNSGFDMGAKKAKGKKGEDSTKKPGAGGSEAKPTRLGDAIKSFKTGGKVKKTGVYRLHKGEEVIPARGSKKSHKAKGRKKTTAKR